VGAPEQYTTVYSGMKVSRFLDRPAEADAWRKAMGLCRDDVLVMQVARLADLKGHAYILDAAGGIKDERVHFCFVGDGKLRPAIDARIHRMGLADRFHLTGLVAPEEVPALLHAGDVLVHCSLREGLARAIPQAMLAKRPVISFDIDGASEVVNDRTGILLSPGDAVGLQFAIETLAGSPELREQLGAAGREQCRERFDHNRMVNQIEAVYRRLMS
jgi:glycosyltransferase involved in cell wall biosynthesis